MDQQQYRQYLTEIGAHFDNEQLQSFGDTEDELRHAQQLPFITSLDKQLSVLSFCGEDATTFLQGQFSNDSRLITANSSQLSSYSSPKGRLFAIFRVFMRQGEILVSLPSALVEPFTKRLTMYIMRSKVLIQNKTDQITTIGVGGDNIDALLQVAVSHIPQQTHETASEHELTIIKVAGITPRYEIVGGYAAITDVWKKLIPQLRPVSPASWIRHDIHAGIPRIYPQTSEAFVAQMVNLDLINGINFKKGCYPGQEVIARLHYRGQSKRRMYAARLQTDIEIKPGASIYRLNNDKHQSIGEIVTAVRIDARNLEILAVLQIEHIEIEHCYLNTDDSTFIKTQFEILELPYSIPT